MTSTALVVGDEFTDHLLPPLRADLEEAGWQVSLLNSLALVDAEVTATATEVWVKGVRIDAIAFRLSLDLLVAPTFVEDDRSFVINELRALWAHILCLPSVRAVNDGYALSALLRDPCAWRDMLANHDVAVAPARFASVEPHSWTLQASGELAPAPTALVAQTLGTLTVQATAIRSVICCAGQVQDDNEPLRAAAKHLCDAGLGLAELLVDQDNRVLAIVPDPAINPTVAPWASMTLVRWLGAAPRW